MLKPRTVDQIKLHATAVACLLGILVISAYWEDISDILLAVLEVIMFLVSVVFSAFWDLLHSFTAKVAIGVVLGLVVYNQFFRS